MQKRRGMILSLETMFYLVVLLILVGIGISYWHEHTQNARIAAAQADCVTIAGALAQYNYEVHTMPDSLNALTEKGGNDEELGPWLNEVKNDPWGQPYHMLIDDTNKVFVIYSDVGGTAAGTPKASESGLKDGGFVGVAQRFEYK